jgi:hypothetical protein
MFQEVRPNDWEVHSRSQKPPLKTLAVKIDGGVAVSPAGDAAAVGRCELGA